MLNYVMLVSRQGSLRALDWKMETADRIGKVRLAKWFQTLPTKQKTKIVKDVTQLVLARRTRMCNFLEYKGRSWTPLAHRQTEDQMLWCRRGWSIAAKAGYWWPDTKVIYRRYASLFFICAVSPGDNELITLEIIHRYVEVLDRYFGNVRQRPLLRGSADTGWRWSLME